MPDEKDLDGEFTDGRSNDESVGGSLSNNDDLSVDLKEDLPASTPIRGKLYDVVGPTHSLMAYGAFNTKQFLAGSASKHSSSSATSFIKYTTKLEEERTAQ